jgi:ribosomal protein L29
MDIKEQILLALGLNKDEEVKLAWQGKSEDGTIFVSTAEELEAGVDISVLTEDGTTILLPIGTYKTDTGVSFRVEEEGVVAEVMESETEEEIEAEDDKDEKEEMTADEAYEKAEFEDKEDKKEYEESVAEETDWAKTYEEMKEKVDNLEDAIADIKARLGEGKTEDVEMEETTSPSKNPRTKTTKTTEVVEFSVEELKAENEKLKAELAASPAGSPLVTNKFTTENTKPFASRNPKTMSKRERFLNNLIK